MKRLVIMISILVLAFTACSTDSDNDNGDEDTTLTINGVPTREGGYAVRVYAIGTDVSTFQAWQNANYGDNNAIVAASGYEYSNVFTIDWFTSSTSGDFPVVLIGFGANAPMYYASVSFSNGYGTTQFGNFIQIWPSP